MTVSGSSGKFTVNPAVKADETAIICSPTHARGRTETRSSPSSRGSIAIRFLAIDNRFPLVSIASLGAPVVPDVVAKSATSLATVPHPVRLRKSQWRRMRMFKGKAFGIDCTHSIISRSGCTIVAHSVPSRFHYPAASPPRDNGEFVTRGWA